AWVRRARGERSAAGRGGRVQSNEVRERLVEDRERAVGSGRLEPALLGLDAGLQRVAHAQEIVQEVAGVALQGVRDPVVRIVGAERAAVPLGELFGTGVL